MLALLTRSFLKRIFNFSGFRFALTGFFNTITTYAIYLILIILTYIIYYLIFAFLTALIITTF